MRNKFERDVAKVLGGCLYEPEEHIKSYMIEGTYLPDFVPKREDNILIEAKGRFRTRQEAKKYIAVREYNPGIDIVFVFYDPYKPMPGARRRKDGTKYSMAEWADKHSFEWYTIDTIPNRWRKKRRGR